MLADCYSKGPQHIADNVWPQARSQLAPTGASAIRLCRYSGVNVQTRLALVSSRLLQSPVLVRELVSEFGRLPPLRGAVACPADDGSQIVALLAYPRGHRVTISVGLTGCELVTNGSVHRAALGMGTPPAFGPQLVAQLKRLVSGRSQPGPDSASVLVHGRWSVLARSPLGTRYDPSFVWDGRELLELGGSAGGPWGGAPVDSGAAYDPMRHRWRRVTSAPAAVLPPGAASVWTGRQVFIFGGPTLRNETSGNMAGLYDPATNQWTVSRKAPVGPPVDTPTAVWTGRRVILAVMTSGTPQLEVASYDPASDTWSALQPPISAAHPPMAIAMVATNDGVLLWSLWGRTKQTGPNTYTGYSGVDVYRLGPSGSWANVTDHWPQGHTVDSPIFTGSQVLLAPGQIWCGACSHPAPFNEHGYQVDPKTLHRTPIPHGPLDDLGPQIIWTGAAEISLNQGGEITGPHVHVLPGDIAIWNPNTGKWARGPRAPRQLDDALAVWNGHQLFALAHDGHLLAYGAKQSTLRPSMGGAFPNAPHSQRPTSGGSCPLAPPNPYLPSRAGCVTVRRADIDGDGRPDLILLYAQLSTRRFAGGLIPTSYTLELLRASGGKLTTRIPHPVESPTIDHIRDINDRAGAEIFIHETHISSGELVGVYTFNGHALRRVGGFWWGGDSAQRYGFTRRPGHPSSIVQRQFVLEGPSMTGRWQRTDTTYIWIGPELRNAARRTTQRYGIPPRSQVREVC